jgi:prepilin-type N-terminal cleavage/methylation domain-containing protein
MSATRGYSLIELMCVLVVAGIVLALTMPAFGNYRNSMSLKQANAQVLQDVRRARQLAITRHAPVVMRFGAPPTVANITSYTIHVDTNGDNLVQSGEAITWKNLPTGTRLSAVSLAPVDSLRFDSAGQLLLTAAGTPGGRLVLSNRLNRRDTLLVSAVGVCFQP